MMYSLSYLTPGDNNGCFCGGGDPVRDSGNPGLVGKEEAGPVGGRGRRDEDVDCDAILGWC